MRVLWIVNLLLPQLTEKLGFTNYHSGTWLFEWSKKLSESNNEFAIACIYGNKYQKITNKNITFYLLPGNGKNMLFYTKKYEKIWKKVIEDFKPSLINIHGTEYTHGLTCMRSNPKEKYLISMQGILTKIKDVDYGGLRLKDLVFCRTFKENIKFNGLFENHFIHTKNSKYEKEMIKRANAIAYVNDFDYSFAKSVNPNATFFNVDYDIQTVFKASKKWSYKNCDRYSIFTNPGGTPLKGLHQLLKAVSILKNDFPKIKVIVPGMGDCGKLIVNSGYSKYISKLIKKLEISDNVLFLKHQPPQKMVEFMVNSNLVVIPSAIEGTSLILREAMYLGCPCIASRRGGMTNFISNGVNGFNYEYEDYHKLAELIKNVFYMKAESLSLISNNAIAKTAYYDSNKSFESLINAYNIVCESDKKV